MKHVPAALGFALLILLGLGSSAETPPQKPRITMTQGEMPSFSQAEVDQQGKAAAQLVKPDTSCQDVPKTPLGKASRAAVQIIHKSLVYPENGGYHIGRAPSDFCAGHPLAGENGPPWPKWDAKGQVRSSLATRDGVPEKPDGAKTRNCSGFLVDPTDASAEKQRTIATAAHCMKGRDPKNFCDEFVFVFNRACGKETFSADEVQECESGKVTDGGTTAPDFNLHSEKLTKDHAVFRLKKAVPKSVAEALKIRTKRVELGAEHPYYAIGYPEGSQRSIAKLEARKSFPSTASDYCFTQYAGYLYNGNSGGPIVDRNGELVGIAASVDDKEYGGPSERQPTVMIKDPRGPEPMCKTQVVGKPMKVETVNVCGEIKKDLNAPREPAQSAPTKAGAQSTKAVQ